MNRSPDMPAYRQTRAAGLLPFARRQIDVDILAGSQAALHRLPRAVVEQPVPDQPQLGGLVIHVDDIAEGVDDDDAHRRHRRDMAEHLRDGDTTALFDITLDPARTDPAHRGHPDGDPDSQREQSQRSRQQQRGTDTHAKIVRIG